LTDTVGFIRNLPHHLIRAFRSTLDEVCYADAILVVIDASDPEFIAQTEVTGSLIEELGAADKPVLYVYNKCDKGLSSHPKTPSGDNIYISAATGEGTQELVARLEELATAGKKEYVFEIPSNKFALVNVLYSEATVLDTEYTENGARVTAVCDKKTAGKLSAYIAEA
jgi:GTP-binding protein HflX